MNLNRVELAGHLGADPEFKLVGEGRSMAILSLATNEKWGKREDEGRTDWHRVVAWGATADFCRDHLRKGQAVFLMGQLRASAFEKDGQKHHRTEVHVQPGTIQMLPMRSSVVAEVPSDASEPAEPGGESEEVR